MEMKEHPRENNEKGLRKIKANSQELCQLKKLLNIQENLFVTSFHRCFIRISEKRLKEITEN